MSGTDCIEVIAGAATWYRALHIAIFVAGGLSIAVAGSALIWKFVLFGGLLVVFARLWRSLTKRHERTTLRLFYDGTAVIGQSKGFLLQGDSSWVSRWVCIVSVHGSSGTHARNLLVCAASNPAADYRRLLQWLRMRNSVDSHRTVLY
ncbi:MAG: hypothetical protein RQ826_06790 [Xanthomonadales bacterium]|nr:hypothetical protein [Xanthomonadales bacterium]